MGKLINLGVRLSGMGWVWEKTDGYKTYIAAALAILSGLLGLGTELLPLLAAHDAGAIFAWLKQMPQDQSWITLVGGIGALGLGHSSKKAAAVAPVAPEKPQ